jgi:hypothetical protein
MAEMRSYDVRVTVERIEGRSICGLARADRVELGTPQGRTTPDGVRLICEWVVPLLR